MHRDLMINPTRRPLNFTGRYRPPVTYNELLPTLFIHARCGLIRNVGNHLLYSSAWIMSSREIQGNSFPMCSTSSMSTFSKQGILIYLDLHERILSLFALGEIVVAAPLLTLMQQICYLSNFVVVNLTTSLPSEARLPDPQILAHRLREPTSVSASLVRCFAF